VAWQGEFVALPWPLGRIILAIHAALSNNFHHCGKVFAQKATRLKTKIRPNTTKHLHAA
jgi:hypothetical protein